MPWLAAIPAMVGIAGSLFGAHKQQQANADAAAAARVPFGSTMGVGPNGMFGMAGQNGFGFGLGDLSQAFNQAGNLGNYGFTAAQGAMGGVPQDVSDMSAAFRNFDPNLGPINQFAGGAGALSNAALAQAFSGNNTGTYTNQALSQLRAAAAPQNAASMRDFQQGMYSTGRGAVTGAPGSEDSVGGGALAAAFGRGLGQSDLDLQTKAQQYGINGATSDSNLMSQAFGRFNDSATLGSNLNNMGFTRGYGMAQNNFNNAVSMAQLPPQLAQLFANLGTTGSNSAINFGNFGLNFAQGSLNNQIGVSNAARGAATNLTSLANGGNASPIADAFTNLAVGSAPQDWFKNIVSGGGRKTTQPDFNYGDTSYGGAYGD